MTISACLPTSKVPIFFLSSHRAGGIDSDGRSTLFGSHVVFYISHTHGQLKVKGRAGAGIEVGRYCHGYSQLYHPSGGGKGLVEVKRSSWQQVCNDSPLCHGGHSPFACGDKVLGRNSPYLPRKHGAADLFDLVGMYPGLKPASIPALRNFSDCFTSKTPSSQKTSIYSASPLLTTPAIPFGIAYQCIHRPCPYTRRVWHEPPRKVDTTSEGPFSSIILLTSSCFISFS